ncbi:CRP/FNR family transcriptional regulator, anaerobic regulatory protein [Thermoflexibacter ruber]|uniref:CRP/FNR family transcriptional regulator, anaerobic regulatory protein n=2 Tax=Thermoflexibacter ruber TaxID=1003 RepID=A0A1I2AJV2_9BACT|nr:CRP/FNR family transcriptional regulator, anaerobic regulatory protein [Thermoflexibacter ruber]
MDKVKDVKYWYLRNHQIFSQMNEQEIKMLCVISGFKRARKNDLIFFDEVKRIYFLKKGIVKIIQTDAEGNEKVKDFLQQGDIFGDITLEKGKNSLGNSEYAKAVSDEVIICSFMPDDFEQVLEKNPSIALKLTKKVGEELRTLQVRYNDLIFRDVKTRLINFLVDFSQKNGKKEQDSIAVKNFLTHQDIADIIGATRQTVTSLINELERDNKLHYSRSKIIIPNINDLKIG